MELSILNQAGKETGKKVALNDAIFAIEPNDHAIYLDVKQFLANNRQGTAKAKQRSENAHSTRKLGRQKGGGGARPGDLKSPVRVGGGTIFGPVPRDYDFKLNKKVKRLARRSALNDNNVFRSSTNLKKANVITAGELNTYSIMNANTVIFTEGALAAVESTLA